MKAEVLYSRPTTRMTLLLLSCRALSGRVGDGEGCFGKCTAEGWGGGGWRRGGSGGRRRATPVDRPWDWSGLAWDCVVLVFGENCSAPALRGP